MFYQIQQATLKKDVSVHWSVCSSLRWSILETFRFLFDWTRRDFEVERYRFILSLYFDDISLRQVLTCCSCFTILCVPNLRLLISLQTSTGISVKRKSPKPKDLPPEEIPISLKTNKLRRSRSLQMFIFGHYRCLSL